jgi:hypothetical protein
MFKVITMCTITSIVNIKDNFCFLWWYDLASWPQVPPKCAVLVGFLLQVSAFCNIDQTLHCFWICLEKGHTYKYPTLLLEVVTMIWYFYTCFSGSNGQFLEYLYELCVKLKSLINVRKFYMYHGNILMLSKYYSL